MVKNLPAMQETGIQPLDWEDPPEEGMATHSSVLAWRIPQTEGHRGLLSMRLQRAGHDQVTDTLKFFRAEEYLFFQIQLLISSSLISLWPGNAFHSIPLSGKFLRFSVKKDLVKVPWSHESTECLQLSCQICPIKRVSMLLCVCGVDKWGIHCNLFSCST